MKNWIGKSIIIIGAIDTLLGMIFLHEVWKELMADGLFNTVNGEPPREAFFWFVMAGVLMILIGVLVDWIQENLDTLPRFLGWALLAITVFTVFIMPASGAWLFLIPTIGCFLEYKKDRK